MSEHSSINSKRLLKVGLAVVREGRLLLCEPYAFPDLILPGGCLEDDESHKACLNREIKEELGGMAQLDNNSIQYLGVFSDRAAGKSERIVDIILYHGDVSGDLIASDEIKSLVWHAPGDVSHTVSKIVRDQIIPFLLEKKIIGSDPVE
jgi:ADP-ribose pyrophosphatase YjhB (NUDIX family)